MSARQGKAACFRASRAHLVDRGDALDQILGLGHLLAHTRPVNRCLVWLSNRVHSAEGAYAGIALAGAICGMFSWGVALIVPAVLSRILAANCAERGFRVHFPLLVACGWPLQLSSVTAAKSRAIRPGMNR